MQHLAKTARLAALFGALPLTAHAADTTDVTLSGGALIELLFLDVGETGGAEALSQLEGSVEAAGGDFLVGLEVVKNLAHDHPASHIAIVEWQVPDARADAAEAYDALGDALTDVGFFAVQQDTPISFDPEKIYDFTSAWTIAETPEEMGVVMKVISTYFQKIGPVIEDYGIATRAFMMRHPAAPAVDAVFAPQITGLFEWQALDDHSRFQNDERWLEHVDIRNAVLARKEDVLLTTLAD